MNKFIGNNLEGKEHRTKGELTLNELSDTEKYITRDVQRKVFYEEYSAFNTATNRILVTMHKNVCFLGFHA